MEVFIEIIVTMAILLCLVYTILIAIYCSGWVNTKFVFTEIKGEKPFVSIIIPARNEEINIAQLLSSICYQTYPSNCFEVIVVDDFSTDTTNELVLDFINRKNNITLIKNKNTGKKNAISEAIKIAKGELIITTDADCVVHEHWLSYLVSFYRQTNAKMIVAPVYLFNTLSLFQKLQTLECIALTASTAGSLYFNKAIMCNGANLAYTKEIFNEVNGFEGINNTASGDDVLLMYKIKKKYPKGIKFLKDMEAAAFTYSCFNIKQFISQRKRWASKRFSDLNTETKFVSLIVYLFNLFLLIVPCVAFFHNPITFYPFSLFKLGLLLFSVKCVIDFLLLFLSTSFFEERNLLIYFLPEQIIYVFYVVLVGFLGFGKKYEWKGRTINEK